MNYKVTIIGSGNAANVLGRKIQIAGHTIVEVVGRNKDSVNYLSKKLNATGCFNLMNINLLSEIYLIAVTDSALEEVSQSLFLPGKVVVHTAGSVPSDILKKISDSYGVIYPVQTLRSDIEELPEIPVTISGMSLEVINILLEFSKTWSEKQFITTDNERLNLHLGAVCCNNFINHLLTLTSKFLEANNLKINILYPLIEETFNRMMAFSPDSVQTGPAMRNDLITMDRHLDILSSNPALKKIYKTMSESIVDYYLNNPPSPKNI